MTSDMQTQKVHDEDSYIASENGTKSLVAVLDGHGEQGASLHHVCSIHLLCHALLHDS